MRKKYNTHEVHNSHAKCTAQWVLQRDTPVKPILTSRNRILK